MTNPDQHALPQELNAERREEIGLDELEPGQLRPCPFCGGEAERVDNGPTKAQVAHAIGWGEDLDAGGSFIHCKRCHASTALHFNRKENLVSSWNDRARAPLLPVQEAAKLATTCFECNGPLNGPYCPVCAGVQEAKTVLPDTTGATYGTLTQFLEDAARYFESRDTKGEDSAHWANVYNAENCRKAATALDALSLRVDAAEKMAEALTFYRDQWRQTRRATSKKRI